MSDSPAYDPDSKRKQSGDERMVQGLRNGLMLLALIGLAGCCGRGDGDACETAPTVPPAKAVHSTGDIFAAGRYD